MKRVSGIVTLSAVFGLLVSACGGGGGSGGGSDGLTAPGDLAYSLNPATYTLGIAIAKNSPTSSGGRVASYAVSPALPPGLSLNSASGEITGTPAAVAAQATYTVTGTNAGGSTTAVLSITVNPPPSEPTVTFSGNPTSITSGQSAMLTWTSTGATACAAGGAWSGALPANGSASVSPTTEGANTYTLSCSGDGGTTTLSTALTVIAPNCSPSVTIPYGSQRDVTVALSEPVVVGITDFPGNATVRLKNLTTQAPITVTGYRLDPSGNGKCIVIASQSDPSPSNPKGDANYAFPNAIFPSDYFFVIGTVSALTPATVQVCAFSGTTSHACDPSVLTLYGRVLDDGGQPVVAATARITNDAVDYTGITDTNGNYVLVAPIANLPDYFAFSIYKDATVVPVAKAGSLVSGTRYLSADTTLNAVGLESAVVEVEPPVHHIGDSSYGGTLNSQFQHPDAEGISFTGAFTVLPGSLGYTKADITFLAKRIACADTVSANGVQLYTLGNTPADGSYTTKRLAVIPNSAFTAGVNTITVTSKVCQGNDADDFEFANIVVSFSN